eukprot:12080264-Alexandrium_andersonii.AAC.1
MRATSFASKSSSCCWRPRGPTRATSCASPRPLGHHSAPALPQVSPCSGRRRPLPEFLVPRVLALPSQ